MKEIFLRKPTTNGEGIVSTFSQKTNENKWFLIADSGGIAMLEALLKIRNGYRHLWTSRFWYDFFCQSPLPWFFSIFVSPLQKHHLFCNFWTVNQLARIDAAIFCFRFTQNYYLSLGMAVSIFSKLHISWGKPIGARRLSGRHGATQGRHGTTALVFTL